MRFFTSHPASVGESYLEHLGAALWFSGRLFVASLACLLHAFLPFLFDKTGSRIVSQLSEHMIAKRSRVSNAVARRDVHPQR